MKVMFLSDWLDNPYKKQLSTCLMLKGIYVEERFCHNFKFFILQVLQSGNPSILHLHTLHPFIVSKYKLTRVIKIFLFMSQSYILKLMGTKIIWTVHEWSNKIDDKINFTPKQAKILGAFLDGIITHCESTKQDVIKKFSLDEKKHTIHVVPHGNYIDSYSNSLSRLECRSKLNIADDNVVFLLFGGIYRYKGILETIDAFKHLNQDKVSLVIAGQPFEDGLEENIVDSINEYKNILFYPKRIPDNEVQIYMNASDCAIVPYKVFTTSGVAILAMSFGLTCIAPNTGFFSDTLDNNGAFLYNSNCESGLLQAMQCALKNKDNLSNMGKYNLRLAEKWNWTFVAEETLKVYQKSQNRLKLS